MMRKEDGFQYLFSLEHWRCSRIKQDSEIMESQALQTDLNLARDFTGSQIKTSLTISSGNSTVCWCPLRLCLFLWHVFNSKSICCCPLCLFLYVSILVHIVILQDPPARPGRGPARNQLEVVSLLPLRWALRLGHGGELAMPGEMRCFPTFFEMR